MAPGPGRGGAPGCPRRTQADLDKVAAQITSRGRRVFTCIAHVKSVAGVRAFIDAVGLELGRLDVLVNNAGGGAHTPPDEMTEEEWDEIIDTNVKGMFFTSQAAPV